MKIIKNLTMFALVIMAAAWSAKADQPVPVAIYDTFKRSSATPPPGYAVSFEGVFTSIIGKEVVKGTSRMDVKVVGDIAYCKFTWVSSVGTLVVQSVCVLGPGPGPGNGIGAWHVASGTGIYKHFKAIGTETFGKLPPGGLYTDHETFAGITTNDNGGDE